MNLPFFIAGRYLFAKKSHNVINIISAISSAGMAVGTAALIIILSVYNGFDSIVRSMLGSVEPDLMVTPAEGKVFVPEGDAYSWLYDQPEVSTICTVLQENVFISYDGQQRVATAKGVDAIYEEESPLRDHLRDGDFILHRGDVPLACVGAGLAYGMGINPRFVSPLEIYFPSRKENISLSNPAASLRSEDVYPSGIFSVNTDVDNSLFIVPINVMRNLLEYTDEVSAVEIRMVSGTSASVTARIGKELSSRLGPGFDVKDRFRDYGRFSEGTKECKDLADFFFCHQIVRAYAGDPFSYQGRGVRHGPDDLLILTEFFFQPCQSFSGSDRYQDLSLFPALADLSGYFLAELRLYSQKKIIRLGGYCQIVCRTGNAQGILDLPGRSFCFYRGQKLFFCKNPFFQSAVYDRGSHVSTADKSKFHLYDLLLILLFFLL